MTTSCARDDATKALRRRGVDQWGSTITGTTTGILLALLTVTPLYLNTNTTSWPGVKSCSIIQVYVGSEVVVLCLPSQTCTSPIPLFFDSRSTPLPHSSRVSILSTKGPSLVSAKLI